MNQQFITEDTLDALGIDLQETDKASLLDHLNEILQERVGAEVAASLDDAKLKELLDLEESATGNELGTWLEQNVPNLKEIVQEETDIILGELSESSDDINKTV